VPLLDDYLGLRTTKTATPNAGGEARLSIGHLTTSRATRGRFQVFADASENDHV
jgi:hypothetical protein